MTDVIIFSNTRGFQKNKVEIDKFIETNKPSIFLVAEHFQSTDCRLKLDGYILAASYCRFVRERGGVAIFVRADLEYKPRRDLDFFNVKKQFEVRSVEVPLQNLVVTVAYRPPSGKLKVFHESLDRVLKLYNKDPSRRHFMAGDFNVNNCDRNSTVQILKNNNFKFTFHSKTHDAGACLDNFIVDFLPSSQKVMDDKLSDHNCVQLVLPDTVKDPFGFPWDELEDLENRRTLQEKKLINSAASARSSQICKHQSSASDSKHLTRASNEMGTADTPQKHKHFLTAKEKPVVFESATAPDEGSLSQIEYVIVKCLFKEDFVEKLALKLSDKVSDQFGNILSDSLEEDKDRIQDLQDRVASLEDRVINVEDNIAP